MEISSIARMARMMIYIIYELCIILKNRKIWFTILLKLFTILIKIVFQKTKKKRKQKNIYKNNIDHIYKYQFNQ